MARGLFQQISKKIGFLLGLYECGNFNLDLQVAKYLFPRAVKSLGLGCRFKLSDRLEFRFLSRRSPKANNEERVSYSSIAEIKKGAHEEKKKKKEFNINTFFVTIF